MRIKMTAFVIALGAFTALAGAEERRERREARGQREPHEAQPQQGPKRVWDPNLAQWRVEHPRQVWDPNLAQYRHESRREVWDPYLAQYRPRDAQKDPAPPPRLHDSRHWHPGRSEGCVERH
jgi:hypothetical protein